MKTVRPHIKSAAAALILFAGAYPIVNATAQTTAPSPRVFFLAVGKAKPTDPAKTRERATEAVLKVTQAAKQFQPSIKFDIFTDETRIEESSPSNRPETKGDGNTLQDRLRQLARTATPQDTVIIYTHSHGIKGRPGTSRPTGGMLLVPGEFFPNRNAVLCWDDYAELLMELPAKNIVVLTMSCFSGGLIETLNSPDFRKQWEKRREEEERNLIVLTSQNKDLISSPIVKNKEIINPFTYAVAEALEGKADGFSLKDSRPDKSHEKDGKLTAGELVDFILYTTANTESDVTRIKNSADPQCTGSFNRNDVLIAGKTD